MTTDIISKLELACVASCSCLTKTPDHQHHSEECRYRVLNEAMEHIAEQQVTICNQAQISASDSIRLLSQGVHIGQLEEQWASYRTSAEAEIQQLRRSISRLQKHIEVVSLERNNIALERDASQERERQLRQLLTECRDLIKNSGHFEGREYCSLGIAVNAALSQPQEPDDGKCRCFKYCLVANGGQTLKLDGTPRECRGLPGDNNPLRWINRREPSDGAA
jgi:hypothetical protein